MTALSKPVLYALAGALAVAAVFAFGYRTGSGIAEQQCAQQRLQEEQAQAKVLEQARAEIEALRKAQEQQRMESDERYSAAMGEVERTREQLASVQRLRDPGARPRCPGTVPATAAASGMDGGAATGAELSAEAAGFLRREAERADRAAILARECVRYVIETHGAVK